MAVFTEQYDSMYEVMRAHTSARYVMCQRPRMRVHIKYRSKGFLYNEPLPGYQGSCIRPCVVAGSDEFARTCALNAKGTYSHRCASYHQSVEALGTLIMFLFRIRTCGMRGCNSGQSQKNATCVKHVSLVLLPEALHGPLVSILRGLAVKHGPFAAPLIEGYRGFVAVHTQDRDLRWHVVADVIEPLPRRERPPIQGAI